MKNSLLKILKWGLLIAYLIISLGFAKAKIESTACNNYFINVRGINEFVNEDIIKEILSDNNINIDTCNISSLNFSLIEEIIESNHYVRNSEVYTDFDGNLYVIISQINPILRIITKDKGSFYIDSEANKIPLSPNYTAHVPILSGNIKLNEVLKSDKKNVETKSKMFFDDIFNFIIFTQKHDLWKYQFEHIYVTEKQEIEIVPRLGNYIIKIGSLDNYEFKLKKLEALYRTSFGEIKWDMYSGIDLRYSDQIILQKR